MMISPKAMCMELVEFAGFTQLDIALRIGYSPAGVSRIMSHSHRSLRYETGRRLESLYSEHRDKIDAAKRAKMMEIAASLGGAQ